MLPTFAGPWELAYTPDRAGFVGDAYMPANETNETGTKNLVSLNMATPVRSKTDMRDNPKTINRSGVYIYNTNERSECEPSQFGSSRGHIAAASVADG